MEPIDVTAYVVHNLFAGLWTGSILFLTLGILPIARDGGLDAAPLHTVAGRFKTISRVSVLLLLVTGGHMAAARYTRETLTGTGGGYLVLSMLTLWFVTAGISEVGAGKLTDGTGRDKVREPARNARPFLLVASVLAVLLLANAGLLSARNAGLL